MNVIRVENSKVRPTRGRGRGRGRDCLYWNPVADRMINNTFGQPKYQSSVSDARDTPRGLFNTQASSSVIRTPVSKARTIPGIPTSSSKIRSSVSTNAQATSVSSTALDSTVVMAITTGRGDARCEVGMAAIDVKFPHLIISQISDTQTYLKTLTKIHLFNPVEIIMPDTICGEEDPRKALYNAIKLRFKDIQISPVGRVHFNEENGLDRIKTHCSNEFSSIELFVKEKYYALSTTAALLKYVEQIQRMVYEPKSMKIEFQAAHGSTLIDVESAINLELVSSQGPHKHHNLFASLDRCVTPMGRRLLRSSLLQPLCNRDAVLERQTCVSELVNNRNLHTTLQPIVKQLFGADRLLGLSMRTTYFKDTVESAEKKLNYILILKTCLDIIPQLADALENATSAKFLKIQENLKDPRFENMREQILEIVQSDAKSVNGYTSANMQRCFALKSGINDMLDVARQMYCELMEQTSILVESLAKEYHLPLIVACNASLGHHIQMQVPKDPSFKISDLPCVFIEVQKKRSTLFMTTYLLMSLSQQCKEARNDLHIMSSCILEALILNLIKEVGCLFKLSEDIAELDLIMSLARISGIPDFVKPKFAQKLLIIDSKHPIVDLHATQLPRPNDIEASIAYNFCNITGPNMSGKTTYLKQIVLLQIMAQIGCYLPAKEATLRIADRIFCRLCPTYEDIESNASSFIQEIREVEYILQFITPSSLIVLDEICRSTNSEEGAPLAFAICESLLQSTAFIFNCTHYLYLTKLTELYHNAVNYYFVCEPNELDRWGLKYTYKLRKGITNVENYGISAASASRLPKSIVDNAKKIVTEIAPHFKPAPLVKAPKLSWEKDCYECIVKFMDLIISNEFSRENVQKVIEPLRGNKNLKISKDNALLCNVLQKNFQKQVPDKNPNNNVNSQNNASSVSKSDTETLNAIENGKNWNSVVISDREIFKFHQDVQVSNIPKNYERRVTSIELNFPQVKFPRQHSVENDFSFKVPDSPIIRTRKSKIIQSDPIQNSDAEFKIFKQFQTVDKSLDDKKSRTLYDFGFSKQRKDFQKSPATGNESRNRNFNLQSQSNLLTEKSSSNLSSYSRRSKISDEFNQEETSGNSLTLNISSSNTSKNDDKSLSNSLKRTRESDEGEDYESPNGKRRHLNKSRNYEGENNSVRSLSSSRERIDRQENSEYNYRSDDERKNVTRRKSPASSFSIFSPRSSPHPSIVYEKNSIYDEEISRESQSQKTSFSILTPTHSILDRQLGDESLPSFEVNSRGSFCEKKQQSSVNLKASSSRQNENISERITKSESFSQESTSRRSNSQAPSLSIFTSEPISLHGKDYQTGKVHKDFSPSRHSQQNSFDFYSDDSISHSYLSPSYSPLTKQRLENTNKEDEEDSKSSQKRNFHFDNTNSRHSQNSVGSKSNSSESKRKVPSSPFGSKSNISSNSSQWKKKFQLTPNEEKLSSQKSQPKTPVISIFNKNSSSQEMKSPYGSASQKDNYRQSQRSIGLNLFQFSKSQSGIKKPPIFKSQSAAWKPEDMDYFRRSLSQSPSNNFSEKSSITGEIESEGLLPKKPKYDIDSKNVQLNADDSMQNDSLSSFNTENMSPTLIMTPIKSQLFSLATRAALKNQEIPAKNSSQFLKSNEEQCVSSNFAQKGENFPTGKNSSQHSKSEGKYHSSNFAQKGENFPPGKNSSQYLKSEGKYHSSCFDRKDADDFRKKIEIIDKISLNSDEEDEEDCKRNSLFESIIDGNTIEFDENCQEETNKSDVYVISSEDSVEASSNIRRKEDAIFQEIEDNATDEEMFLRRLFESPLSMPYSEELCSCSQSSE